MTFVEIFDNFKNHFYIRRESWSNNVFIQLRNNVQFIRLVEFEPGKTPNTLNNDVRLTTEDLLADDWINLDEILN